MKYAAQLETRARREYSSLARDIQARLTDAIDDLENDPHPPGAKRLVGRQGYRVRVGDYRILYTVEDREKRVRIYRIGHRREVYRGP